jgi:hypothetical protein
VGEGQSFICHLSAVERLDSKDDRISPSGPANEQTVVCAQASSNTSQGCHIDATTFGQMADIIRRQLAQEEIIRFVLKMASETGDRRGDEEACETKMTHR